MGAAAHLDITGDKGGESKPKTPVEAPDSLQSTNIAKLLLAVGEGEFDGIPTDRDIYLDNTPIVDASGNVNFPGVKWEWRSGSVEQEYIQGIPAVENETTVNVELRSDNPFARALSNTQLSAVRVRMSWPRLAQQDSSGNTNGYRIEYAIDIATDGGAYVEAHRGAVDGKTTNGYQRSVRVDLPKATSGWMMRVRRLTPNANKGTIADTMTIAGYTEIIDEKLRYPNTALLYIEFDAQQFQNIPAVTVDCNAKRWPVPSNYNPITRTYTGIWDGTFKQAWTNNPAFVTYGLCVEDRFGLGKRIKSWMVDKWEMYRIAQYCDQQVPDGVGGQEPRFLCDLNLQGRAEAWTLLRDLSAIYRGMVYWAHGSLFMQADMPRAQDIDYVFTRANVIDGEFVYGGAERSTHYSRALVSYDNPANNYDTDVIPVTDNALQRRYRDRPIELSAIGCTRASEAQRRGKWALLSNSQDRTVTFKTGIEGRIPLPGYVIPVADELVAGRPNGGRISSAAGRVVTLDRDTPIKAGDRLIVNLPNGTAQARTVRSIAGRAVTVTTDYGVQPEPELQWAIDYDDLAVQLFRVLKTVRTQEGEYEITALEFNPSKFAAIDTGAKLDERPISIIPVTTVAPPASVSLSAGHMIDQGIAISTMTIAWPAVQGAVAYDVEWRKDNGNWIRLQRTGAASVDVVGIYAGAYLARVRSVSAFDITSIWKSSDLTQLNGKAGLPPAVTSITTESLLFGIGVHWTFPPGAEDTQRTELWYSQGNDVTAATKLSDLAYPQSDYVLQNLRAGAAFFFWARLVDRTGNVGPFYPAGVGVRGEASSDAGAILDQIAGQVGESALGKELAAEIGLISGIGPGSVNERLDEANALAEEARARLGEQIAAVDTELAGVKTELQQQIDNIADLADSMPYKADQTYTAGQGSLGADGIIYQAIKAVPVNTPPPNTTYWLNVGQAVATANGLAARVQTVETKVTSVEGVNTSQAQQITGLRTDVDGKASASSVQSIGNRVTTAENSISSQGSAITGLNNSLSTTNTNVSAAQTAANNAASLAGSKGKVLVQTAAPAAADQLAQNLWIDITGGANTPKRWNGSVWAPVTDKVATDAAAAAASALTQVQTKADAAAVSALTNRVTATEGSITSLSTNIVSLNNSIAAANASGDNVISNPSFDPNLPNMGVGQVVSTTAAGVPADCPFKYATRLTTRDHIPPPSAVPFATTKPGDVWRCSALVACASGTSRFNLYVRKGTDPLTSANAVLVGGGNAAPSATWTRITWDYVVTPGVFFVAPFLQIEQPAAGGTVWYATDWHFENVTVAKGAQDTADVASSAVVSLTSTVTSLNGRVTSNSGNITNLQNSVGTLQNNQSVTSQALQGLTSEVTRQGTDLTSASNSLVSLSNTIPRSVGNSPTKVYESIFTSLGLDTWAPNGANPGSAATAKFSNVAGNTSRATLTIDCTTDLNHWWGSSNRRVRFDPTRLYKLTARVNQLTKNGRDPRTYMGFDVFNEAGVQLNTGGQPALNGSHYFLAAASSLPENAWVELVCYVKGHSSTDPLAFAGTVADPKKVITGGAYFTPMCLSGHPYQGGQMAVDYFRVEDVTDQVQNEATAAAVSSLNSTVTQLGDTVTSSASSVTLLTAAIKAANSSGDNIIPNASFDPGFNQMGYAVVASTAAGVPAKCPFKYVARLAARDHAPQTAAVPYAVTKPGDVWRFSALVACGTGTARFNHYVSKGTDPNTFSSVLVGGGGLAATSAWTRVTWDYVVGAGVFFIQPFLQIEQSGAMGTVWYATDWHVENISAAKDAQNIAEATASALTSTNATVTAQGNTITAQASQLTSLTSRVGSSESAIQSEATTRNTADQALGRRVDTVQSSVSSATALIQSESSTRANADAALGRRVDTVQSSLGDTNASVQQTSTALAGLNGQVNAQYSVKVMTTTSGMKVAAGFGLGLESEGGVTQSTFAVSADRFVVLNSNLGGGATLSSPFAVENGQVFIADAYIKKATIQQGIVGQGLYSQTFTNYGSPVMNVDFNAGQIIIQNRTTNGAYMFIRQDGIFMVQNGVVVVELSIG
jgi:predicted phage tail protein